MSNTRTPTCVSATNSQCWYQAMPPACDLIGFDRAAARDHQRGAVVGRAAAVEAVGVDEAHPRQVRLGVLVPAHQQRAVPADEAVGLGRGAPGDALRDPLAG